MKTYAVVQSVLLVELGFALGRGIWWLAAFALLAWLVNLGTWLSQRDARLRRQQEAWREAAKLMERPAEPLDCDRPRPRPRRGPRSTDTFYRRFGD